MRPGSLLSSWDNHEGTSESYMDQMNKFDPGVPVAIGYKFKNNIGVSLRVKPGINDITKYGDEKDCNFQVGLGVTYSLNLKK